MSGENINFDDKKIKRSSFYNNKKINNIEALMLIKDWFLKMSHAVQKVLTNTLSDTMIMVFLDHYV